MRKTELLGPSPAPRLMSVMRRRAHEANGKASPRPIATRRSPKRDPHVTAGRSGSARPGAAARDCAAGANAGTLGAVLEAPALVAGLDDVAVVGERSSNALDQVCSREIPGAGLRANQDNDGMAFRQGVSDNQPSGSPPHFLLILGTEHCPCWFNG